MRRVAGPQDDDWNADSHERWTKCCDLAMLLVFLVAVVAVATCKDHLCGTRCSCCVKESLKCRLALRRGVPRLSVCLFVCGIYAGVYMRLSVCLFVCGMYVEFDLVATARLCRVSHKMRISANPAALISAFHKEPCSPMHWCNRL